MDKSQTGMKAEAKNMRTEPPNSRELVLVSLLFASVALVCLFFCSVHSPFYRYSAFPDANTYMGVAQAMRHGLMPYRDVFDHKGPLLYLINYLAAVMFSQGKTGIYFLSSVSLTVFLVYGYRIARLILPQVPSLIATFPLILLSVGNHVFYHGGGSTEEFLMPGLMACLYYLIRLCLHADKNDYMTKQSSFLESFATGIFCGMMLWIKYTTLPAIAASFLIVYIFLFVKKRGADAAFSVLGVFSGALIVSLPCLFFLWKTGLFKDMWSAYVLFNYSYTGDVTAAQHASLNAEHLYTAIPYLIASVFGLIYLYVKTAIVRKIGAPAVFVYTGVCALFVFAFGRYYNYYFLALTPFLIFTTIAVTHFVTIHRKGQAFHAFSKSIKIVISAFIPVLIVCLTIGLSIPVWKEGAVVSPETDEERCADAIRARFDDDHPPSILCFVAMDTGIIQLCETYPQVRYFYVPNVAGDQGDQIFREQVRYIEEGRVDVVYIYSSYDLSYFLERNPSFQLIYKTPDSEYPGDFHSVYAQDEREGVESVIN